MQAEIQFGNQKLRLNPAPGVIIPTQGEAPTAPLIDAGGAVAAALEEPLGFPALRLALTPDDRVAVVVDDALPELGAMLNALLDHLLKAHIRPEAITLIFPSKTTQEATPFLLPPGLDQVQITAHDPTDRRQISYLATTRRGRRIYLNRTVVDADQVVVLAGRRFDSLLGYSGAEGAIYPSLSDEETHKEMAGKLSMAVPGEKPWPPLREAAEVAWLLGAPFMVHCIEAPDDKLFHVVAGTADTSAESVRLLNARWRVEVDQPADLVIAGIGAHAGPGSFLAMATGLGAASRVVKPDGRIVLLCNSHPHLPSATETLRQSDSPALALKKLRDSPDLAGTGAFLWVSAAQRARLYILSGLGPDVVEEMFATPLENAGQVERLLGTSASCILLPNADKTMAVARTTEN